MTNSFKLNANIRTVVKCEWCEKTIRSRDIIYYGSHVFCSWDCKANAMDHYDVDNQIKEAIEEVKQERENYYE